MGRVIGLISTNYSGANYGKLIEGRPVASIPFGGRYRLIDFPLSSMANSGIDSIGVITPANYRSLADHLNMGREWGLNKKQGGMFMLPGAGQGLKDVSARFSLRDIMLNVEFFERADEEHVLMCASNRVYNMDFRPVIEQHEKSDADITLIYKTVPYAETATGIFLVLDEDGKLHQLTTEMEGEACIFLDAMLIKRQLVLDTIACYENQSYLDLMTVIQENLNLLKVDTWEYTGYEHAVDDAVDYMEVSQRLLDPEVQEELFTDETPILTKTQDSPPAKYLPNSMVKNSLVAASCILDGRVEDSVLFRNVVIGSGAVIRNCVIMQNCQIGAGAILENVILDKYCTVGDYVHLTGSAQSPIVIGKRSVL